MSWTPVAHLCELMEPGSFVMLPWRADGEVAIVNVEGEVFAFDNICPHRGARIFTELRGNAPPRCAYHGRLITSGGVQLFGVRVQDDFFFVDSDKAVDLCEPPMAPPRLTLHSTLQIVMDCDWTVAVENALDFEHVAEVHAGSLAKLALTAQRLECYADGSVEEFASGEAERLDRMAQFFPDTTQSFDYKHVLVFPHSCLSSTRGWTYSLQHYFPRADGRTNFIHRLYAARTTRPMPEFFDSVAKLNAQVFAEDAAICARVAPGFKGKLGPGEDRIRHFRSLL